MPSPKNRPPVGSQVPDVRASDFVQVSDFNVKGFHEAVRESFGQTYAWSNNQDEQIERELRVQLQLPAWDEKFNEFRIRAIREVAPNATELRRRYQKVLQNRRPGRRRDALETVVAGLLLLEFFHLAESSPFRPGDPLPSELCLACRLRIEERHVKRTYPNKKSQSITFYFPTGGKTQRRRQTVVLAWGWARNVGLSKRRVVAAAADEFHVHRDTIRRDLRRDGGRRARIRRRGRRTRRT